MGLGVPNSARGGGPGRGRAALTACGWWGEIGQENQRGVRSIRAPRGGPGRAYWSGTNVHVVHIVHDDMHVMTHVVEHVVHGMHAGVN